MAEFKISDGLTAEIQSFQTAAASVGTIVKELQKDEISTLETCVKYTEQYAEIGKLLEMYVQLVQKDTADVMRMISETKAMDEKIGKAIV